MYRPTSQQDLQRSLDSGKTWQPIFHDAVPSPLPAPSDPTCSIQVTSCPNSFAARDLQVARPDSLVMAEAGNGDAVVRSDDQGHSWGLADLGVEGKKIASINVAPGHPEVMYATVDQHLTEAGLQAAGSAEPFGLDVSKDGGATWQAAVFPAVLSVVGAGTDGAAADPRSQVQVDGDDPGHVWMLINVYGHGGTEYAAIFESRDYGMTWAMASSPSAGLVGNQLLVVRTPTHALRLYLNSSNYPADAPPLESRDDGVTWSPLPVPRLAGSVLTADPADPDTMVYAGYFATTPLGLSSGGGVTLIYFATSDSWDHAQGGTPLALGGAGAYPSTPLKGGASGTDDPTILMQADRFGDFYLLVRDLEQSGSVTRQGFYQLTPVLGPGARLSPTGTGSGAPGSGAGPGSGSSSPGQNTSPGATSAPPPLAEMPTIRTCTLPISDPQDQDGALTFDGENLLYTNNVASHAVTRQGASGSPLDPPSTSTIHRMDPQTCTEIAPLIVHFDLGQLAKVEQAYNAPPGSEAQPHIVSLSYDHGHDTIWMSIATPGGGTYSNGTVPVFSAAVDYPGDASRTDLNAGLRLWAGYGGFATGLDLLAYDFTDDTLWSRPRQGSGNPAGHISLDGTYIPSCWDASGRTTGSTVATWVLGGPGRLYVQSEDDKTLWEIDDRTCATIRTFTHRDFGEPSGENEQMACDAFTFGVDSAYAHTNQPTSVIWLRDAINQQVVAYGIPDGVCPFPTTTTYLGSSKSSQAGQTRFCAHLERRGVRRPIPNRPMVFTLAGATIGTGTTNRSGVACVDHQVDLAGGLHRVIARFPGDDQYLPSQDTGTLTLATVGAAPIIGAIGLPSQLAPPSGQQPSQPPEAPVAQAQAAEQAQAQSQIQAQAEVQAQAQSQAQAQAGAVTQVQPGMMVQAQRRTQVATQEQGTALQAGYQASALRRSRAPMVGIAVAFLVFGFGVLVRRPRWATARLDRSVRRRG